MRSADRCHCTQFQLDEHREFIVDHPLILENIATRAPGLDLNKLSEIQLTGALLRAYYAHIGRLDMKAGFNAAARKRPVNLTLNEDLVSRAKSLTDNLSGVVESLLAEFVDRESRERIARAKVVEATVVAWNEFNADSGSIADEYSSL